MIKKYINLFNFIKDMPKLKDCIIIFPHNIEEQFMLLKSHQCQSLKRDMERLNIKMIVEKGYKYDNIQKTR